MTSISVIICSYTEARWHDLNEALDALAEQTYRPIETIVVVDHNPALCSRLMAARHDVRVVENGSRRGLAGARNTGTRLARGSLIAFLDDDAVPDSDWLRFLAACYEDERVLGVGGAVTSEWLGTRPSWFPQEFEWVVGCSYRGMPGRRATIRNLIGANMSFRRDVLEHVGGFRENMGRLGSLPLGCEETELCIRARQEWPNREFVYEPRARVRHKVPHERGTWAYFRSRCYAEGISKAQVAQYVGSSDGLSSERAHVMRTLPAGVLRACSSGHPRQAVSILAGLATVIAGYSRGRVSRADMTAIPALAKND